MIIFDTIFVTIVIFLVIVFVGYSIERNFHDIEFLGLALRAGLSCYRINPA